MITTILNDDGTEYNPPKNPLWEKWLELYPPTPKPEYSQVCDGYSCALGCSRCPYGDNWKCPEEDREVYEQYAKEFDEYMREHNPSWYK